jgi:spore maturation protein B
MAPTLIGLMSAVSALRASGILNLLEKIFLPFEKIICLPSRLVPLVFVRLFSTSAATGFLLDIFREYGPDSLLGFAASIIMSCTEAAFYTMSIYFTSVQITKTRWTFPGAIFACSSGIAASLLFTSFFLS